MLGVERTWTLDEIEVRYRALVREHHPDLHRQGGEEAVAAAEARTRELNEAMRQLRELHPESGYAAQNAGYTMSLTVPTGGSGNQDGRAGFLSDTGQVVFRAIVNPGAHPAVLVSPAEAAGVPALPYER